MNIIRWTHLIIALYPELSLNKQKGIKRIQFWFTLVLSAFALLMMGWLLGINCAT